MVLCACNAHLGLGDVDRAMRLALGVLKQDNANAEAYRLSSKALYLKGEFDQVLQYTTSLFLSDGESAAAETPVTFQDSPVRDWEF